MSRSYGPTTPPRAHGRRGREETDAGARRDEAPRRDDGRRDDGPRRDGQDARDARDTRQTDIRQTDTRQTESRRDAPARRNTTRSGGGGGKRSPRQAPLTGAERGRYILKRSGHFALMAAVCIVINIAAIIVIGGIAFGIYSLTK